MPKKTEELEAIFIFERQRWGETTITSCVKGSDSQAYANLEKKKLAYHEMADAKRELEQTVKVDAEEGELEPGLTYRFYGSWVKHWKHGMQFHAKTFTKIIPHDKTGIINYLMKAPGIGKARAEKLWKEFKGDAVKALRTNPVGVCDFVKGLKPEAAKEAAAYLEEEKDLEDATIDVFSLLASRGMPKKLPKEAIKKYGNKAAAVIRKNPYCLMTFKGVGFSRADDLYLDLGLNPAKLKRQTLAIWSGIHKASDGHTWFSTDFVEAALREKLSGSDARPVDAIKLGLRAGLLAMHKDFEQRPWFCTRQMSQDEEDIAFMVGWLSTRESAWPELLMAGLSDHQQTEMEIATATPVGVFAGTPGTGKSFAAARLVARIGELNGYQDIAVIAPTGKAAVRVTEAMNECGVDIRAKTVHSLLRVANMDGNVWTFEHNEDNPIEQRYVIVDEASMLDTPIMASLVRAMRKDGHLLLVGDLQQLPPVGHGAPLRDLLKAGVSLGNLTEIRRNSGTIVETCAAIRDQKPIELATKIDPPDLNLAIMRAPEPTAASRIESLIQAVRDRELADAIWDTQVIVALNSKSSVSREPLNKSLQLLLNEKHKTNATLWLNDKIVCLRNQQLPAEEEMMETVTDDLEGMIGETSSGDVACYVANGEIGKVIGVYPNKVVMEFLSPRRVVFYPKQPNQEVEGFDLGYAISCHKSQGSQWKIIIVALDPSGGARRVCDRSWLYTSISRASEVCFLVGMDKTAVQMCRTQKIDNRKTFLEDRFRAAVRAYEKKEEGSATNSRV